MAKNTSFILGSYFETFVASQVECGRYANAADVIRSGLRLLDEHLQKQEAIRRLLLDRDEGGAADHGDIEAVKATAQENDPVRKDTTMMTDSYDLISSDEFDALLWVAGGLRVQPSEAILDRLATRGFVQRVSDGSCITTPLGTKVRNQYIKHQS